MPHPRLTFHMIGSVLFGSVLAVFLLLAPPARALPVFHLTFEGTVPLVSGNANIQGSFDWGLDDPLAVSNFDVQSTGALVADFDTYLFVNLGGGTAQFFFRDAAGDVLNVFFPFAFFSFPSNDLVALVLSLAPAGQAVGDGTYTSTEIVAAVDEPVPIALLAAGLLMLLVRRRRAAGPFSPA